MRDLFRTEALALRSAAEADAALGILISTVREKLIAADGRKLVPAVLDVLTRYYWTRHPSLWLGKGLKLASAALWGASGTRTDLHLVADCLGELALFERITTARVAFDLATTGLWVASAEGVTSTGEVQHALKDIANAFELRGGARRLMPGIKNTFQRLALEDASDFHSKLLAKCEWVGGVDDPVIRMGQLLFPLIVVDQPTIGQTYSGLVEHLGGVLARAQGCARP